MTRDPYSWGGPSYPSYDGEMKGTSTANDQRKQELQMQNQAFNTQMNQLTALNNNFAKYLSGNQGFTPQQYASMQSQFLNSNNQTFNQAGQQVREALASRGEGTGQAPVGGNYVTGISNLMGAKAQSQSQGQLGLQIQNAMQALSNQFNAGNLLSGTSATLTGTQGVAGGAAASALNNYMQGANSGFGASFMSAFGQGMANTANQGIQAGISAL